MSYWQVPRIWDGGECWIIGGGASMPHQFGVPDEVISKVESKAAPISAYSDYLAPLHSHHVVGVNLAFLLGPWVSAMYFCDSGLFRNYWREILKFPNLKVTCTNHIDRNLLPLTTNIKRLKRDNRYGLSSRSDTICWNFNSGGAAIDFAVHAGAKRILLLGFDMRLTNNGHVKSHWHSIYQKPTQPSVFRRFLRSFPAIARDAKQKGVEILNVNPESAIQEFRKVKLSEVL